MNTCSHLTPSPAVDVPRIRHELLARHLRNPQFFLETCVRWKYLPTHTPVVTLDPFHVLVSPTTTHKVDGAPLPFLNAPVPGVTAFPLPRPPRGHLALKLPPLNCPDSQIGVRRSRIRDATPAFGVSIQQCKGPLLPCLGPRWLAPNAERELSLQSFLTPLDPAHIPQHSARLAKPPEVEFEVDLEPAESLEVADHYTATLSKRVATVHRNTSPPAAPPSASEWASKQPPPYLRPTPTPLLHLAQARYCYLRSVPGGAYTLPQLIEAGLARVERERNGASTLDWSIAASLQQLGGLTSLWPADPLCAPPHFEHWLTLPTSLPPDARNILVDLTNLTRQELRTLCSSPNSLPTTACVYVTPSDARALALLRNMHLTCVHTFADKAAVLYKEKWWRSGNQALYPSPSKLSIWASPDLVPSLTHDRAYSSDRLLAAIAHYPTPFAPMPTRYADCNSHTRVGSTHDPSHWLLATDGSVARRMTTDGTSIRRMAAGVVLVRPANASWAECPATTDAYTAALRDPAASLPPSTPSSPRLVPSTSPALVARPPSNPPHAPAQAERRVWGYHYNFSASPSPEPSPTPSRPATSLILDALPDLTLPPPLTHTPPLELRPSSPPFPSPQVPLQEPDGAAASLSPRLVEDHPTTQRVFSYPVAGVHSSLRAELGALLWGLYLVPRHGPVLIATDSLSAIHLLCRWNRNTDFAPYVDAATCHDLVLRILLILHARKCAGGVTRFIFTRSHHGEPYNEAADRAAAHTSAEHAQPSELPQYGLQLGVRTTTIIAGEGYSTPDPTSFTPWSKSLQKRWSASVRQQVIARAAQNPTRAAQFLLREHMGRRYLGTALHKLSPWNARTYYRAITYQLPTQTRLAQWGKVSCNLCPLCGTQPET